MSGGSSKPRPLEKRLEESGWLEYFELDVFDLTVVDLHVEGAFSLHTGDPMDVEAALEVLMAIRHVWHSRLRTLAKRH